jgi:hypothetical protein
MEFVHICCRPITFFDSGAQVRIALAINEKYHYRWQRRPALASPARLAGVLMGSRVTRCAESASPHAASLRRILAIAISLIGLAAAACQFNGGPLTTGSVTTRTTIAIESIDGPPPALVRKLATDLAEEAEARKMTVVAREDAAQYSLRGYLTPHVERGTTKITWVWDVYGADKKRVLRITGDEPSGNNSKDAWAAVDERVLRRIARNGLDRILIHVNASQVPDQAAIPDSIPLMRELSSVDPRS